jgi:hypothetical protein
LVKPRGWTSPVRQKIRNAGDRLTDIAFRYHRLRQRFRCVKHIFQNSFELLTCCSIECESALIAACIPILRPLFTRFGHLSKRHKGTGRFSSRKNHVRRYKPAISWNTVSGDNYPGRDEHDSGLSDDLGGESNKHLSPGQSSNYSNTGGVLKTTAANVSTLEGNSTVGRAEDQMWSGNSDSTVHP